MKRIKKLDAVAAQSVYAFAASCYCNCTGTCVTCQNCQSSSQVYSLRDSASANYNHAQGDTSTISWANRTHGGT